MIVFEKKTLLTKYLHDNLKPNSTLGFVPTMGALHDGHLSLLEKSMEENSVSVISIFVNPTQFNNPEDLKKYPRTLEKDVEKIKTVSSKIIIYAPSVDDIYEGKTVSQQFNFGRNRKPDGKENLDQGHFDGVGTIVKRLFEIINPTNAYFGEKDFQQLQIVKKLVEIEKLPVKIIGCPIFREKNGLAMSSRNERLTQEERNEASIIFKNNNTGKKTFGTKSANEVSKFVEKQFESNKMFTLEYFQIANEATLLPCKRKSKTKNYRAFIAVFVNNIRLIDTISLN